jgi:hypothetical protein
MRVLWVLFLILAPLLYTEGSPTGVSGGFVLGAQWFAKNQNEGVSGQYLTTDYKEKVVRLGFEKVAEKVYQNFKTAQNNFLFIIGIIIFEVVVLVGVAYNHYAAHVKIVKKGVRRSNPNVV